MNEWMNEWMNAAFARYKLCPVCFQIHLVGAAKPDVTKPILNHPNYGHLSLQLYETKTTVWGALCRCATKPDVAKPTKSSQLWTPVRTTIGRHAPTYSFYTTFIIS
jgi:hypothetical protein